VRKGSLPGSAASERACLPFTLLGARVMHSPHERTTTAARKAARSPALKIYYLHPLLAGPLANWQPHLERARRMGFGHLATPPLFAPGGTGEIFLAADHEGAHPALGIEASADEAVARVAEMCRGHGLGLFLDIVLDRVANEGALANSPRPWFRSARLAEDPAPDPRSAPAPANAVYARFDDPAPAEELTAWWIERLVRLARAGVAGFRCDAPHRVPPATWRRLIAGVHEAADGCRFLAWTPGLGWLQLAPLADAGFDGVFSSAPWWDGRASWFVTENEILRRIAPVIAAPEVPFDARLAARFSPADDLRRAYLHRLRLAAATGSGLLVPMGFEFAAGRRMDPRHSRPEDLDEERLGRGFDLESDIRAANAVVDRIDSLALDGELRALTSPASAVTALLRVDASDVRDAGEALTILINPDLTNAHAPSIELDPLPPSAGAPFGRPELLDEGEPAAPLAPGEVRLVRVRQSRVVKGAERQARRLLQAAPISPRIVIDNVTPSVDAGRFATKRIVGETIRVEADIFAEGHDVLGAEVLWRAADEREWRRVPMVALPNDRWAASFAPARVGKHLFTIEAWRDEFGTLCREIEIKRAAGVDVSLEAAEGRQLLAHVAARGDATEALNPILACVDAASADQQIDILLAPPTRAAMAATGYRPFHTEREPRLPLEIERPQAGFASWYELFPRSATDDPDRHGRFDDVIALLPTIHDMGFDVLYFPPIHPIGTTNRKGRNNSLRPEPGDLGSPYAIGSLEGGHDAIHPALGTIEDFRRLERAAREHGLEIALDFAIQCSPDHPWLKQHPGWFRWRPDGSLRYAENPPKKYEDIVNVDFYAEAAIPDLWIALRDVVLFWVGEGVRLFRVDNPHTKPLPFWEWLIEDVRGRHPDVIFLSEAFTRPKMMYRLAKLGFSQSYTYFTWRNSKQELREYLTELTTTGVREYFRPHFFVNTPDINPFFLQNAGRAGFLIRAALATTLSGLWGMYSGFELCEAAALPGREEYLDSEKYEIRVRDRNAPGNIVSEITTLNRLRKANPALQSHLGLRFYNAFNDQVLVYGKALPSHEDMILVAVSLDPHHVQEAVFEIPLWEWRLPDHGSLAVEDLMRGHRFVWTGKLQRVRLDPSDLPFALWRIAPVA
jgi:starch synthase (maltosyl-transferring)